MSVSLMSIAFRSQAPSTQKLVLLALCDSANDQGECYPAVLTLAKKCSLSDRAVQAAISDLEGAGHLHREMRPGRSTVYWLTPHEGAWGDITPERGSPPNVVHPRTTRTPAPNVVHPTPERGSPITIKEPSRNQKRKKSEQEMATVEMLIDAGFDRQTAEDFIAHKAAKKAPLTLRAWSDHLREAAKAGWTPVDAAEKVMARNWSGFESKYVADKAGSGTQAKSFRERDAELAAARVAEMTGGRVSAKPVVRPLDTDPWDVIDMEGTNAAAIGMG